MFDPLSDGGLGGSPRLTLGGTDAGGDFGFFDWRPGSTGGAIETGFLGGIERSMGWFERNSEELFGLAAQAFRTVDRVSALTAGGAPAQAPAPTPRPSEGGIPTWLLLAGAAGVVVWLAR